jgi:hypothetical protein
MRDRFGNTQFLTGPEFRRTVRKPTSILPQMLAPVISDPPIVLTSRLLRVVIHVESRLRTDILRISRAGSAFGGPKIRRTK